MKDYWETLKVVGILTGRTASRHIDDLLYCAGAVAICAGCYAWSAPLGIVVAGLLLIVAGLIVAKAS